jgi:hypothetical protein
MRPLHVPLRAGLLGMIAVFVAMVPAGATARSDDQQIADDSVLTIDDVPSVFKASKVDSSDDPAPGKACKDIRKARKAINAAPNGEVEFQTEPGSQGGAFINNKVAVFKSKKAARSAITSYSTRSTPDCFRKTYEDIFAKQLDDPKARVDVQVTQNINKTGLGDADLGYDMRIDASAGGQSQSFYVELELIRVGRAFDGFAFFNSGSRPPANDVADMIRTGVGKLEAGLQP